jgi:hypothetical protein
MRCSPPHRLFCNELVDSSGVALACAPSNYPAIQSASTDAFMARSVVAAGTTSWPLKCMKGWSARGLSDHPGNLVAARSSWRCLGNIHGWPLRRSLARRALSPYPWPVAPKLRYTISGILLEAVQSSMSSPCLVSCNLLLLCARSLLSSPLTEAGDKDGETRHPVQRLACSRRKENNVARVKCPDIGPYTPSSLHVSLGQSFRRPALLRTLQNASATLRFRVTYRSS